eukprot:8757686-Alexandrium_andersonii.AAC.1
MGPALATRLPGAEIEAKAAQAAVELTRGILGSAGKGGGGGKAPAASKGRGCGKSPGPKALGPAGTAKAVPASL